MQITTLNHIKEKKVLQIINYCLNPPFLTLKFFTDPILNLNLVINPQNLIAPTCLLFPLANFVINISYVFAKKADLSPLQLHQSIIYLQTHQYE